MRNRALLAILSLCVTFLSAGAVVILNNKENAPAPVDYWSKRITACQDKSLLTTEEVLAHSYDCLKSAIWDSVTTNSFPNFVAAADPIMAHDIKLEYVCHIPAHDLGAKILDFYKNDYRKAILDTGYDLCGSGFVHSLYDVWGLSKHTKQEWIDIGGYCNEALQVRYNACGDAIGHAAYESSGRDLRAAMLICDLQRAYDVLASCGNGAYMQDNFPQSSKLKKERPAVLKDPSEWSSFVTFCDTIPFETRGAKDGCYFGAGWVMGNTIFMRLNDVSMSSAAGNEFDTTPEKDKLINGLISSAIDACESGADTNRATKDGCIYIMLARMPLFYYRDISVFTDYCKHAVSRFPEYMLYECLASGHEHIDPELMAVLSERYPPLVQTLTRRGLFVPGVTKQMTLDEKIAQQDNPGAVPNEWREIPSNSAKTPAAKISK
jgi:hypothetical protein